ncbi:MAG TPA: DmsE family decaheme c-type cytochrome [Burkholderiales bacterium]|nr:DmsE family decaheme c-type cytochrome [Burkholderiales bacterium]
MLQALRSLLLLLVLVAGTVWMTVNASQAAAQPAPGKASPEEICKTCHADRVESYLASKHGQKGNTRGPSNQGGCLACHTDAALEHAAKGGGRGVGGIFGFNNPKISIDAKTKTCLACHSADRHLAFWDSGKHRKNDVACNNCHSLHGTPGPGASFALQQPNPTVAPYETTVRQLQYETCTSCHRQIRSQLLKPSHHPIIEGRVKCSDCHNPHGALSPLMVKNESINQLCTSCHAEKRGPYIWEHPPVEENCLTCHNPHGSNHNRLLAEKAPNVCQDCHDAAQHPGSVYDATGGFKPIPPRNTTPNTRLIARGCVNCHNNLHGSNAPAMRGKFFLR